MKQHFICVEQSTRTVVLFGEMKILTVLLYMSVIHQRSVCDGRTVLCIMAL